MSFHRQCIIAGMLGNPGETCSAACELRYKSLGHTCWYNFNMNHRWLTMQQLCDSNNDYETNGWFTAAPSNGKGTPLGSGYQGQDPNVVSSGNLRMALGLGWGSVMCLVLFL